MKKHWNDLLRAQQWERARKFQLTRDISGNPKSPVGRLCFDAMTSADALIEKLTDISGSGALAIRLEVVDQMSVWYYG
jgi:hypothetical protein